MKLKIETGDINEILRKKAAPVKTVDKKILKLIKDMEVSLFEEKGVGLAAPQVGVSQRVILVLVDGKKVMPMINPEITDHSDKTEYGEEGCLSLPGKWGQVQRYKQIIVKFQNEKGQNMMLKMDDFNARIVQHEIDHLDGILFTDYLNEEDNMLNLMRQKESERL